VEVAGKAQQHVSVGVRPTGFLAEQRDHLAKGLDAALIEIGVHPHGDVMGRGFSGEIGETEIIADDEFEFAAQGRLP
jgi:hypothetical protein